ATVFLSGSRALPDLHSFPPRRSSDLVERLRRGGLRHRRRNRDGLGGEVRAYDDLERGERARVPELRGARGLDRLLEREPRALARSEEHTSELQSREKLVCRLLLEKKK